MKKAFKYYAAAWAVLLAAFNLICFITPDEIAGYVKIDRTFWVSFAFINLAFVCQLGCAYLAFKAENAKKLFLNLPLIKISWTGLILTIVAGVAAMMIPGLPSWIGAVVCILIFAFTAVAIIKAKAAAEAASSIDEKIKSQTSFIKNLTVDAEGLVARAKSDAVKTECGKVYEAVRYSDPMSNGALSMIEAEITVKMSELASAVGSDDAEKAKELAEGLVTLIAERNNKCKLLKP